MTNRLERTIHLLRVLQSGVPYNTAQLSQELGVHRRTVFRDISALRSLGLPIEYDPDTSRYWMSTEMRLPFDGISANELIELLIAAGLTKLPEDSKTAQTARKVIVKLTSFLPKETRSELGRLLSSAGAEPGGDDTRLPRPGAVDAVLEAIRRRQVLRIEVATGGAPSIERFRMMPYQFVATEGAWCAFGNSLPENFRLQIDLALVEQIEVTDETFELPRYGGADVRLPVDRSFMKPLRT